MVFEKYIDNMPANTTPPKVPKIAIIPLALNPVIKNIVTKEDIDKITIEIKIGENPKIIPGIINLNIRNPVIPRDKIAFKPCFFAINNVNPKKSKTKKYSYN